LLFTEWGGLNRGVCAVTGLQCEGKQDMLSQGTGHYTLTFITKFNNDNKTSGKKDITGERIYNIHSVKLYIHIYNLTLTSSYAYM
jgi:hypothetical protein